jgi:hypothetical protein
MTKPRKVQYAIVYGVDGMTAEHVPANGKRFTPEGLRRLVGGYLESLIPADKRCRQMYCDEDGMSKQLPPNPHTQAVCDMWVYNLNGYGLGWRVLGPIVAVLTREVE